MLNIAFYCEMLCCGTVIPNPYHTEKCDSHFTDDKTETARIQPRITLLERSSKAKLNHL